MPARASAIRRCAALFALAIGCATACGQQPQAPADTLLIGTVQGAGPASRYAGQTVSVQGVVTGDYQDNDSELGNNLGGFYLQDEHPDDDPLAALAEHLDEDAGAGQAQQAGKQAEERACRSEDAARRRRELRAERDGR